MNVGNEAAARSAIASDLEIEIRSGCDRGQPLGFGEAGSGRCRCRLVAWARGDLLIKGKLCVGAGLMRYRVVCCTTRPPFAWRDEDEAEDEDEEEREARARSACEKAQRVRTLGRAVGEWSVMVVVIRSQRRREVQSQSRREDNALRLKL